ncbi:septal ring lytic transglycosylase RlpA family protein [Halomonas sp. HP20-15]|uniref:septal ring lytic transglycosylase RlpA family protein n=1 Tax=Halomonas sp. HP20-15 TaxID=3085901 RepID=UPI002981E063|nr:septal ring lytic transglycosylase RlpA family protein [Halomonas sp. HP20-15]MDW5376880.1 septal ring lytic transglycosylase RlpA family protein [Halomonas sp. HP20-15]
MRRRPGWALLGLSLSCLLAGCAGQAPSPGGSGESIGQTQQGVAAYYASAYQGRRTASGERFDAAALTAAHRSLAFGTRVRVTNLANQRQVTVRVNDRGPYTEGRIIDLSRRAAERLAMIDSGTAPVRIEVVR